MTGFKRINARFVLLNDKDITKLNTKSRFKNLFDLAVLSITSVDRISEEFSKLLKDKAPVHCESADHLGVVLDKKKRPEFR